MKIAVDLDNTVFNTCSIILDELSLDNDIELKSVGSYWIEEAFGIDKDLVDKAVMKATSSDSLPILSGADKVLNWLQEIYPPLYFISDRRVDKYRPTWNQLEEYYLENNIIILTDNIRGEKPFNKAYLTNELNIDIFIDDKPDVITDLYDKTKCEILVFDRPWNKEIEENDRIYRMKNWSEIRDFFIREINC